MQSPLAGMAAGWASVTPVSGRKSGCQDLPVYGPMRFIVPLLCAALSIPAALAQTAAPAAPAAAATPAAPPGRLTAGAPAAAASQGAAPGANKARPEWRDTSAYRFPSVTRTVSDLQNMAHALRLRDYCADARVKDDFVRERLARFSAITGREETCRTLLDY